MTVVLGLDTASNRWHAVGSNGVLGFCSELKGKDWDAPKPKGPIKKLKGPAKAAYNRAKTEAMDRKRLRLCDTFGEFLAEQSDDIRVYCEQPLALQNPATNRDLSGAAHALWTVGMGFHVEWFWVDVAYWKRVVIGNGNADKEQIVAWVKDNVELGSAAHVYEDEEDLYDAAGVLQLGLHHLNIGTWPDTL